MPLPSSADYDIPICNAHSFFDRHDLKKITPERNSNRSLIYGKGGSAIAYKASIDGKLYAIRCFIRLDNNTKRRYQEICEYINKNSSVYFLKTEYIDDSILVNGVRYPIIKMEWANGDILYSYVVRNKLNIQKLEQLIYEIQKLFLWLKSVGIAHGDLSHQNIIVGNNSELKLIDYDGIYIDKISHLDSGEGGTPEFTHPKGRKYSKSMDDFSMWIIYSSLIIAKQDSSFVNKSPDSIVFGADDLHSPNNSAIINRLCSSGNKVLNSVALFVTKICNGDFNSVPTFSQDNINNIFNSVGNIVTNPINGGNSNVNQAIIRSDWHAIFGNVSDRVPITAPQKVRSDWKDIFKKKD